MKTWLFAPGHDERKARKALASPVDVVILDWEDAVPEAERARARRLTCALADELGSLDRLAVRVNNPDSDDFERDRVALGDRPVLALLVPKVESVAQVEAASALGRPLMLILESALGIELAFELASSHGLVRYLAFGPLDLLADLGGTWTREGEELLYARSRVVIAARAANKTAAIDGPYPELHDLPALEQDTARSRRLGYAGRLLIHPEQIDPVQRAFAPSEKDLDFARRVLDEAERGEAEGRSAITVDGRFVDPPVIKWAKRVLNVSE